jgi:hypothetical protein
MTESEFDQHLLKTGLISSLPDPALDIDVDDPEDRPVTIKGEPLSETIIRERRWDWNGDADGFYLIASRFSSRFHPISRRHFHPTDLSRPPGKTENEFLATCVTVFISSLVG